MTTTLRENGGSQEFREEEVTALRRRVAALESEKRLLEVKVAYVEHYYACDECSTGNLCPKGSEMYKEVYQ